MIYRLAIGGDIELARLIAAVIGEEAEQVGWYRMQEGKVPAELPFLTDGAASFAFTLIQEFTLLDSCPNKNEIPLETFQKLTILTPPGPHDQVVRVSFMPLPGSNEGQNVSGQLFLTYVNQQNLPFSVPLEIVANYDSVTVGEAFFPYEEHFLNGFTLAAVTTAPGPFPNADAVARVSIAGPGLIIVH